MKNTHISRLAFLALALALMVPKTFAIDLNSLPRLVDQEDSPDLEDEDDPCNPPAANDGPNGDGSPCEKNSAPGMAVWRVSQPYINLWLHDTPFRYRLASGKWMELNLSYKQRGETREEFIAGFGPGWSCNWIGLAVRSNASPDSIFLHKAGGGREILTPGGQSPRTLGQTCCLLAPCPWDGSFWISSPSGSSRNYTTALCSPDTNLITYLFRSFSADRYGRATIYNWAGYQPGGTCYARLNTVVDRDGLTNTLYYTNALFPSRITCVSNQYGLMARFFYDQNGRLTNITDTIRLASSFTYDHNGVITNLHTDYGNTGFRHFETNNASGMPVGRAIEASEPIGTKQLFVYRAVCDTNAVGSYATHDSSNLTNRNSFHWDRAQYAALSDQARTNYLQMPSADFLKASLKHWLLKSDNSLSDTLAAQAGPFVGTNRVDQICYKYQGQTSASLMGSSKRITQVNWNGTSFVSGTSHRLDIGRNTWGRPTSLTFYNGSQTYTYTSDFDTDGRILKQVFGPRNELVRGYGYDAVYTNLLTSVTNAENEVVRYTHDKTDLKMKLTSITYPSGLVTTNYYNGGFLERTIDIGIRTNSFGYQNGNLWYQTNELGLVTTNTWDNLGRLLSTHYPDGTYTSNWWDKLDVVGTRDRMGFWTRYAFNQVRQRTFETNANGQVTQYSYCDCGSPSEIIVWNGTNPVTTVYQHDLAGRMTNIIYPDNYSLTYTFDALSRLDRITDSANRQASLSYNDYNQLVQVLVGASGSQLTWLARTFDEYGRLTNSVDRNGVQVQMKYDQLDRLTNRAVVGGGTERFVYSTGGLTNHIDELGTNTWFVRDAAGRLLFRTNANLEVLQFTYNPADRLVALTDGKQQTTRWNFDVYGRVTNKLDALSFEIFRYKYDAEDRLTNRWTAQKGDTYFAYDSIGSLTNVDYPGTALDVRLKYDSLGRLEQVVDAIGTNSLTYTASGQLRTEDGPWDNDTVTYSYNHRLRQSLALAMPGASAWQQSYDFDDYWRLRETISPAGTFTYGYISGSASPLVQSLYLPGNSVIHNTHDSLGRLQRTSLSSPILGEVDVHEYVYNAASHRTRQTFTAGNFTDYTYDGIGQLKTAKGFEYGGATPRLHEQFGYAYDHAWNLAWRTNNALVQEFKTNPLNELTNVARTGTLTVAGNVTIPSASVTVSGTGLSSTQLTPYADGSWAVAGAVPGTGQSTYTAVAEDSYTRRDTNTVSVTLPSTFTLAYDLNGNLTNDSRRVFEYDFENQLTNVYVSGEWRSEFKYDAFGRRKIRREYKWNTSSWLQTNEVRYIYDGLLVVQERHYVPAGGILIPQQTVTYTRGLDPSGSLQGAGGIGGLLARSAISNLQSPHAYYHADGNGNVTLLVATNGSLAASYTYDSYGNPASIEGFLAEANLYRFSSKETHLNSGLVYYLYRFYEPSMQRWLNHDPLGDIASLPVMTVGITPWSEPDDGEEMADGEFLDAWTDINRNLYGAMGNNPVNSIDAFGLQSVCTPAGAEALVIAVGETEAAGTIGAGTARAAAQRIAARVAQAAKEAAKQGAKSYQEWLKHQKYVKQGLENIKKLKDQLGKVKGPKAQKPIQEALKKEEEVLKGHLKEIAQKWPNGCPPQ